MSSVRRLAALCVAVASLLLPGSLKADYLDDFEKLFNDVSTNYGSAIDAGPDSRLATDYDKKLSDLSELADRIQNFIARLQIDEINLRADVSKLKEVFRQRLESKGKGQSKSMGMEGSSGRWFPTTKIKEDVKKLRDMGFTTDNGGSYQKKLAKQDGFDEFESLVSQYARSVKEISDDPVNGEWRLLFEKRLARMKVVASDIQVKLQRELPAKAKEYNFPSEVNFLDKFYKDMVVENDRIQSAKKAGNNYGGSSNSNNNSNNNSANKNKVYDESSGRSKSVTNIERIMLDVKYTLSNIQKGVNDLKGLGFTLEGKLTREAKDKASGEASTEPEVDKDIAAMSASELNGAIQKERDRIYSANVSMSGVSPIVVKYYTKTLTKSQRERYQELVRKYQNRSYAGDEANGMAIRELHGFLKNAEVSETKADLARILEGVRKEKDQFEKDMEKERYARLSK